MFGLPKVETEGLCWYGTWEGGLPVLAARNVGRARRSVLALLCREQAGLSPLRAVLGRGRGKVRVSGRHPGNLQGKAKEEHVQIQQISIQIYSLAASGMPTDRAVNPTSAAPSEEHLSGLPFHILTHQVDFRRRRFKVASSRVYTEWTSRCLCHPKGLKTLTQYTMPPRMERFILDCTDSRTAPVLV